MVRRFLVIGVVIGIVGWSFLGARTDAAQPPSSGIHKIKHVVVIMQENRSFDEYFGTFPGADGLPRNASGLTSCSPDPASSECQHPYYDPSDINGGAAHGAPNAAAAIDGGKMDGFVQVARNSVAAAKCGPNDVQNPLCTHKDVVDVMGYHDAREIPNYWRFAQDFVLQDHLFEPVASWSLPAHLFLVSGWSAKCASTLPDSCSNQIVGPYSTPQIAMAERAQRQEGTAGIGFSWTDLTYLLQQHHVSWRYYIDRGTEPDCEDDAATCVSVKQNRQTPGIWNPLPLFTDVQQAQQRGNVQGAARFRQAARAGDLPAVSWVTPNQVHSEHPPASVHVGQAWVTGLINDVMRGPDWKDTAIFVSWDDWGGFYDHVPPPSVDANGYGIRVPGLVISPYAKRGYIDHQTLSHDAYLKFIEDDFLGGARLDPQTDGRPDPRPTVRENAGILGDLTADFDFSQAPRKPLVLRTNPPPGPASQP
jgi:phospholipase C